MVERFPSGSTFVEVGVFAGKSIAYMAVEIINSGKDIRLVGVDNFSLLPMNADRFRTNIAPIANRIELIEKSSVEAADLFADKSLEFVFIDADHVYESVRADILAWMPKVKSGGILAGHDIGQEANRPHVGVYQAVNELLDEYEVSEDCWIKEIA